MTQEEKELLLKDLCAIQAGREEVMYEMEKEQKPAEWSEEDEVKKKVLFSLIDSIIKIVDKNFLERHGTNREELMGILESLRPQPHWKPSEEQLLALKMHSPVHVPDIHLASLYDDLLKLL